MPRWVTDAAVDLPWAGEPQIGCEPSGQTKTLLQQSTVEEGPSGASAGNLQTGETAAWRDELANRLSSYRARRKPKPPRYPSLRLVFDQPSLKASPLRDLLDGIGPISQDALARDSFSARDPNVAEAEIEPAADGEQATAVSQTPTPDQQTNSQRLAQHLAKIIEFPRLASAVPPLPLNELAEPVSSRPRILDVPDAVPPPPALGGITIESAQVPAAEKRPGIDIPLQSAPLMRRAIASAIDASIVGAGCAASGFIFWRIAELRPPRLQTLSMAVAAPVLLWALYQYLLIVYAGSTPGLRLAKLELNCFSGKPVSKSRRRWRVLASYLSALSLGMGYAWVFLDEDCLCWHDRITHTYLAPKASTSASPAKPTAI
ncbi:MAG: RDD family protein [Candidatus Sulfotelmatobacter sp.]